VQRAYASRVLFMGYTQLGAHLAVEILMRGPWLGSSDQV
jgi:hypothetical protein